MRIGSIVVAALLALTAGSCGKSEKAAARKLRKMDFHAKVDDRGRLQLTFRLFDAKHEQMPVTGAYTAEVTKLDGALLCKASGELAPSDFSDKGAHKPQWADASCPADPGADELKLNVKLTVKGGAVDAEAKGKEKETEAKAKGAEAKDAVLERSVTVAVRTLYERPPVKPPAAGSGSASGSDSASGSAAGSNSASGSAGSAANSASGSAASGSAGSAGSTSVPAEKPPAPPPAPAPAPKGSAS